MKKNRALYLCMAVFSFLFVQQASAQKGSSYDNAVGMRVEFGSKYGTWAGLSGKHFFNENVAGELMLLFGDGVTLLEPELQYHGDIANADGLKWVLGGGAGQVQVALGMDGIDLSGAGHEAGPAACRGRLAQPARPADLEAGIARRL